MMNRGIRSTIFGALPFAVLSLIVFISNVCFAQVEHTGVPFLLIAPDARGRAMAGGGSVYSMGAKSAYYNPANLASSGAISVDITYLNYLPQSVSEISYTSFYLSKDFGKWGHFGLSYNRLNVGKHLRDEDYWPYGPFDYHAALALYSAYDLGADCSAGIGVKYIRSRLADMGAGMEGKNRIGSSIAVDLGVQLRNRFVNSTLITDDESSPDINNENSSESRGGISFGFSILNLGPNIKYIDADQSDPLPRRFLLAAGFQPVVTKNSELNLTVDASHLLVRLNDGFSTEWKEMVWSFGLEAKLYSLVALRLGRLEDQTGFHEYWTTGVGIGPEWLHADFSYVFHSSEKWNRSGGEYAIGLAANLDARLFRRHTGHELD